jgi:hypothetical protein
VAVAFAGLMLSARFGAAADVRFPSHEVDIQIVIGADGRALLSQKYQLAGSVGDALFEYLSDTCSTVGPISGSIDGRAAAFTDDTDERRPWTLLRIRPAGAANGGGVLELRYDVVTRGTALVLPIVMPAVDLEAAEGGRGARVNLSVHWTGSSGAARVVMPRLEPASAPAVWEARLLAIPSSVRIDLSAATGGETCDERVAGTTGGLEWRFVVFVGTMVIWVLAYMWWFGTRWRQDS